MVDLNLESASEKETLYVIPFIKDTFWNEGYKEVLQLFSDLNIPLRNVICIDSTDIVAESSFNKEFYKKLYELSGITFIKANLVDGDSINLNGFNTIKIAIKRRLQEKDYNVKIIMNPPYKKDLHLKILDAMLQSFPKADIINISPNRWLKDPLAKNKKSSYWNRFPNVRKHILDIYDIPVDEANRYFGIDSFLDLGIYVLRGDTETELNLDDYWKLDRSKEEVSIYEKVCLRSLNTSNLHNVVEKNKREGIRVLIGDIAGNRGNLPIYKDLSYVVDGLKDGKDWTLCKNNGGYEKGLGSAIPLSIKFETETEAQNFYDSYKTGFLRYICDVSVQQQNIQLQVLPFLPDYTRPWTDEELYEYFGLTDEEINTIENFFKGK